MKHPQVSIIVPIFNAEQYLFRCLDSIKFQTFADWECILIDDGSEDLSGQICDKYVQEDKRFKVIHQQNKGVSAARQKGLNFACGDYVIHADPDDWVDNKWIEILYSLTIKENYDVVICDFIQECGNKSMYHTEKPKSLNPINIVADILEDRLWGVSWNKLIKRETIVYNGICFPSSMSLWEDVYFICNLLLKEGVKVGYVGNALYHYDFVINTHSIVRYTNKKHVDSACFFIKDFEEKYPNPLFVKGLEYRKILWKQYCYSLGAAQNDLFVSEFSDVNRLIISKKGEGILFRSMSLCLSGHFFIGRLLQKLLIFKVQICRKFMS